MSEQAQKRKIPIGSKSISNSRISDSSHLDGQSAYEICEEIISNNEPTPEQILIWKQVKDAINIHTDPVCKIFISALDDCGSILGACEFMVNNNVLIDGKRRKRDALRKYMQRKYFPLLREIFVQQGHRSA